MPDNTTTNCISIIPTYSKSAPIDVTNKYKNVINI